MDKINENFIHNKYGYCYYVIENDSAIIFNLFIEPEYRRKGHARKLINAVIREIRETGYNNEITIEAIPQENSIDNNNLVLFYHSMGLKLYHENKVSECNAE